MDTNKPEDADFVEPPGEVWVAQTELIPGAVSLTGAIMQNVTHIAPAIAAFLFTTTIVGNAGGRAPLAYLIGFLIVLALGMCLVQLAKHFPSAGGYFTYVSRTLGPRSGWLTGWMFALYSPIVAGPILAFLGLIFEGEFQSNWQWTWFHWWMMVIIFLPIITWIGYAGISISVRTIVVVGALEFLIVLALGLWGLFDPGPGGFTFSVFDPSYNPGNIVVGSGFSLAVVFTVQGLTGWEAAVPLAEETENPRRNVPIATMASIVIVGAMLVLVFWGQVVGWGTANLTKLPSVAGDSGVDDRPSRVGQLLGARADRDVHVGDRREPRLSERGDAHVVRHGPGRRPARGVREGASHAQDADHRHHGAVHRLPGARASSSRSGSGPRTPSS